MTMVPARLQKAPQTPGVVGLDVVVVVALDAGDDLGADVRGLDLRGREVITREVRRREGLACLVLLPRLADS